MKNKEDDRGQRTICHEKIQITENNKQCSIEIWWMTKYKAISHGNKENNREQW